MTMTDLDELMKQPAPREDYERTLRYDLDDMYSDTSGRDQSEKHKYVQNTLLLRIAYALEAANDS